MQQKFTIELLCIRVAFLGSIILVVGVVPQIYAAENPTSEIEKVTDVVRSPEEILGISVSSPGPKVKQLTWEESEKRARPVFDALINGDATKKMAALRLIGDVFERRRKPEDPKYVLIDEAIGNWIATHSFKPTPKVIPNNDMFIAAVNATINMYSKENDQLVKSALATLLDLSLNVEPSDDRDKLLKKWKESEKHHSLMAP